MSILRPERLRATPALRNLVREVELRTQDLVLPIFLNPEIAQSSSREISREISSMPGVSQWTVEGSLSFVEEQLKRGVKSFLLFGVVPAHQKSSHGAAAWDADGPVPTALRRLRENFGDVLLMADTCLCEYTSHGHCGTFARNPRGDLERQHEESLANLARAAVAYAQAGADVVAPSAMMDNMIGELRAQLDAQSFSRVALCSYAVKYASAFYGPFREAAQNAPAEGSDRRAYQMDAGNRREALREALLDVEQGADLLLVKPALSYLDIVREVSDRTLVPVGAYQVSGEYAMIKAAAARGWVNEDAVFMESLVSLKRAGAQFIVTYWAPRAAELLATNREPRVEMSK